MELSPEDALRLNVLLANKPQAIRINESSMTLFGLLDDSETSIRLNPTCPDEKYLKQIRSVLSERALGNPAGYPLYLQRWTRMGKMRDESLKELLKLGDPEAVFAVVCAEGLTDELARRAWWASEEPENARRMLQTMAVSEGQTGKQLARYLIEFLPFETDTETMIESVRVAMRPGLLPESERRALWKKSARKTPYLVGFIASAPDDLPDRTPPRSDLSGICDLLSADQTPAASLLLRSLSENGQLFLDACLRILNKPPTQDVITTTLDVMRSYYAGLRPDGDPDLGLQQLYEEAAVYVDNTAALQPLFSQAPSLRRDVTAMRVLSGLGYGVLRPELKGSSAAGGLMRRKLEPVLHGISDEIKVLLGSAP
ncbi:MAG: sulfur reduction protein DsrS [Gammaproteobacteria bacterium]|nr:sulfur reduction protein DsrS [Gammaproteobacteria bacterium]